jgi:O-antigen ligase
LGAGTGSAQNLIDDGYLRTGYDTGLDNSYNAHNQYLEFLVRNGPVELILFFFTVGFLITKAFHKKSAELFLFCAVFCSSIITESMLNVQKGIVFFYFFSCVFYFLLDE